MSRASYIPKAFIDEVIVVDLMNSSGSTRTVANIVAKVNTIVDLLQIDTSKLETGEQFHVLGYHTKNDGGGGIFYWDADEDKANHNGGTIIDPTQTFPSDWSDTTQQETWFTANGTGNGCWKRVVGDYVTPEMFGAKGDGITDDTKATQRAMNFGVVELSNKTYLVQQIDLENQSLILTGNGYNSILKVTTTDKRCISITNANNIFIDKVHFVVNSSKPTSMYLGSPIYIENCDRIVIKNCWFYIGKSYGIFVNSSSNIKIANNIIYDSDLDVANPSSDFDDYNPAGIAVVNDSSKTEIIGNRIQNVAIGILVQAVEENTSLSECNISDNIVSNCGTYGICVYTKPDTASVKKVNIIGNQVSNIYGSINNNSTSNKSYGAGVYVLKSKYIIVSLNNISETNISTDAESLAPGAVAISETTDVIVSENFIKSPYWYGIAIFDVAQKSSNSSIIVSDNFIESGDNTIKAAIKLKDIVTASVVNNTIQKYNYPAILVDRVNINSYTDYLIKNNYIDECGFGVYIISVPMYRAIISGNIIKNAGTHGIYVYEAYESSIDGNKLKNIGVRGIQIAGGDNNSITNNLIDGSSYAIVNDSKAVFDKNIILNSSTSDYSGSYIPIKEINVDSGSFDATSIAIARLTSSSNVTITSIEGGTVGQRIVLVNKSSHTITIEHNTSIRLNNDTNFAMDSHATLTLEQLFNGVWDEVGRKAT